MPDSDNIKYGAASASKLKKNKHDDSLLGVFVTPLRVKFLTTVGKQQNIFLKHFILYVFQFYSNLKQNRHFSRCPQAICLFFATRVVS